jgi:hypothetical protein
MRHVNIVLFSAIVGIFLIAGCSSQPPDQRGESLQLGKEGKLSYTPEVTKEEAVRLRDYLISLKTSEDWQQVIHLTKKDGVYQVRSVINKEILEEEVPPDKMGLVESVGMLTEILSEDVFNGAKVEWHLCDDDLKTLAVGKHE